MLLAAIMAMVLAAAAPAFAQASAVVEDDSGTGQYNTGQQNEQNTVVQDSICVNVQQAAANQYSGGDQAAAAGTDDVIGDSNSAANAANIANALGITTGQVNACLNQVNASASGSASAASVPVATTSASAPSGGGGGGGGSASAAAGGELPSTGGSSLFALGAGALLVAGGLLARRIVR